MPDIQDFEYLTAPNFAKGRVNFPDADNVLFYADDSNQTGIQRPIALSLNEMRTLIAATQFVFNTGPTPLLSWVIEHNLAKQIGAVTVYVNGQQVYPGVQIDSNNQVTLTFSVPVSGVAIIEI